VIDCLLTAINTVGRADSATQHQKKFHIEPSQNNLYKGKKPTKTQAARATVGWPDSAEIEFTQNANQGTIWK